MATLTGTGTKEDPIVIPSDDEFGKRRLQSGLQYSPIDRGALEPESPIWRYQSATPESSIWEPQSPFWGEQSATPGSPTREPNAPITRQQSAVLSTSTSREKDRLQGNYGKENVSHAGKDVVLRRDPTTNQEESQKVDRWIVLTPVDEDDPDNEGAAGNST